MKVSAIVMAAGLGTRMKSELPKVLHALCGQPILFYILEMLIAAKVEKIAVVVSHRKEWVIKAVQNHFGHRAPIVFVDQKKPRGTGHAALITKHLFENYSGDVVVLNGDNPLFRLESFQAFLAHHHKKKADLTIVSAIFDLSTPYGRIVKDAQGHVTKVVEVLDASENEKKITEMNVGIYCGKAKPFYKALKQIRPDNAKKEYYLTDTIKLIDKKAVFLIKNKEETLGINNRYELYLKEIILREKINKAWMLKGVTIVDSATTYIGPHVKLGRDVILKPGVHLEGKTVIGEGTKVDAGCIITDGIVGKGVHIKSYSIVEKSRLDDDVIMGPFARLRPQSHLKRGAKIGNFVELKKTTLGENSKANHLAYLGDAEIGKDVNISCGVITCNYDGGLTYEGKATTKIGDGAFVGSDCQLVAPIVLEKGAYVASGSTVTRDVPEGALVIARAKQVIKEGYAKKLFARTAKRKKS